MTIKNKLIVALSATMLLAACGTNEEQAVKKPVEQQQEEVKVDVSQQAESYQQYVVAQMADFVMDTELLANHVKEGKLEEAQKLFPLVTMYYERLQPLTGHFTELDTKLNGAIIEGKEQEGTGFQRLAYGLFKEQKTAGYEDVAMELLENVTKLQTELPNLDVSSNAILASTTAMLEKMVNERLATTSYANNEVYAVKAQTEVVEQLVEIFKQRASAESIAATTEKIMQLNELLAYYEVGKEDYVNYSFFTNKQKEELKAAVMEVQQALQRMNETVK